MAAQTPRFTLHPITPDDYPTLTTICIDAFTHNPLHYLTYPSTVSSKALEEYILASKIKFPQEGKEIQTIKVIDEDSEDKKIIGFALWRFAPIPKLSPQKPPEGAELRFKMDFRARFGTLFADFRPESDILLDLMRVSPSYQGQGIGGLLLKWGLEKAAEMGRRVFLIASPEGRGLYLKHGFVDVAEVRMELERYDREGTYVQTAMVWDGECSVDKSKSLDTEVTGRCTNCFT